MIIIIIIEDLNKKIREIETIHQDPEYHISIMLSEQEPSFLALIKGALPLFSSSASAFTCIVLIASPAAASFSSNFSIWFKLNCTSFSSASMRFSLFSITSPCSLMSDTGPCSRPLSAATPLSSLPGSLRAYPPCTGKSHYFNKILLNSS